MKNFVRKLFQWQPSRETLVAAIAGFVVIGLSAAMIPTRHCPWLSILIRDIGQIFLVGILFPLLYILRTGAGSAFALHVLIRKPHTGRF